MAIEVMVLMSIEEMHEFTVYAIMEYWERLLSEYDSYRLDHVGEDMTKWVASRMKQKSEEFDHEYIEFPFMAEGAFLIGVQNMATNPRMPSVFVRAIRALSQGGNHA